MIRNEKTLTWIIPEDDGNKICDPSNKRIKL